MKREFRGGGVSLAENGKNYKILQEVQKTWK